MITKRLAGNFFSLGNLFSKFVSTSILFEDQLLHRTRFLERHYIHESQFDYLECILPILVQ